MGMYAGRETGGERLPNVAVTSVGWIYIGESIRPMGNARRVERMGSFITVIVPWMSLRGGVTAIWEKQNGPEMYAGEIMQ